MAAVSVQQGGGALQTTELQLVTHARDLKKKGCAENCVIKPNGAD